MPRIDRTAVSFAPYAQVRAGSEHIKEKADCAVVAVAAAAGIPYAEAHALMSAEGRKPRRGTPMFITESVMAGLGFKMVRVPASTFIQRYPKAHQILAGVTTHHPDRFNKIWKDGNTYMFRTRRHILTVRNGINCDWTRGTAKRVEEIYLITKW